MVTYKQKSYSFQSHSNVPNEKPFLLQNYEAYLPNIQVLGPNNQVLVSKKSSSTMVANKNIFLPLPIPGKIRLA